MKGLIYHAFSQEEAKMNTAWQPGAQGREVFMQLPAVPCLSPPKRTAAGWNCGSGELPWMEAWVKGGEEIKRLFARQRDFQPLAANWSNKSSVFSCLYELGRESTSGPWAMGLHMCVHRQWVYRCVIIDKVLTHVSSQTMGLYMCVHRQWVYKHVFIDNGFTCVIIDKGFTCVCSQTMGLYMYVHRKNFHTRVHRQWVYTHVYIDKGFTCMCS